MFSNFYNSEFKNNFNLYYKECAKFFLRTYECAVNLGFLPITQEYEGIPGHLIVKYEAISQFQTEVILNQNFNSSHNHFIFLVNLVYWYTFIFIFYL